DTCKAIGDGGECDPDTGAWTANPLPTPRGLGTMVFDPHHGLRMFGGVDDHGADLPSVFELDATGTWTVVTPTNGKAFGCNGACATYVAETDQVIMMASIPRPNNTDFDELWALGASADGWTML